MLNKTNDIKLRQEKMDSLKEKISLARELANRVFIQ